MNAKVVRCPTCECPCCLDCPKCSCWGCRCTVDECEIAGLSIVPVQTQRLFVHGPFPGENKNVTGSRRAYSRRKRELVQLVADSCNDQGIRPVVAPVRFQFTWVTSNRRRDPDNIDADRKGLLDGLQKAGVITNDGWSLYGAGDIVNPWVSSFVVGAPVGVHVQIIAALAAEEEA